MQKTLIAEIDDFIAQTGLSEHRVGMILANNGRLVERLRADGRVWPETIERVREALKRERARRIEPKRGVA